METQSELIMLVDLSIEPSKRAEFDRFYQGIYIPALMQALPEISFVTRYAQRNSGNSGQGVHFVTVYGFSDENCVDHVEQEIASAEPTVIFKQWKQNSFTFFDRAFYRQSAGKWNEGASAASASCWSSRYVCLRQWVARKDAAPDEAVVSAQNLANRLGNNSRTYARLEAEPQSFLTVFNAADEGAVKTLLDAVNAEELRSERTLASVDSHRDAMACELIFSIAR